MSSVSWSTMLAGCKGVESFEPSPHGTYARFVAGCDCPLCCIAEATYARVRRGSDPSALRVLCGCDKRTVLVPADDVRYGRPVACAICRRAAEKKAERQRKRRNKQRRQRERTKRQAA